MPTRGSPDSQEKVERSSIYGQTSKGEMFGKVMSRSGSRAVRSGLEEADSCSEQQQQQQQQEPGGDKSQ
ncbi:Hypothetical predicted protein [Xyrichtys novacula]|uniref:Uncharacterized protein n=1 Tax=Xyrichtys novacula TaxID=13765 RepID=A0AAV1GNL9_XYRNO|nr:Hypothetical predicted protein [Xyrichtys novacula]